MLTGSGVMLDALVRQAHASGWQQHMVVGVPAEQAEELEIGGLSATQISPLCFGRADASLAFPVPGMSDVMPYESTVFSRMSPAMLREYRDSWRAHLKSVIHAFQPDLIHSNHAWIMSSLLAEIAPRIPWVVHCHGTGLRQIQLNPEIAAEVRPGLQRADHFFFPQRVHAQAYATELGIDAAKITVSGSGYREDLFHAEGRLSPALTRDRILYAGKLCAAKGLPQLLQTVLEIRSSRPGVELYVAGGGVGVEAEQLREQLAASAGVHFRGRLDQAKLAELARSCDVFVLPSFYEGLPLVLVEALACGCRLVSTALPGIVAGLAAPLGDALALVPMPRLLGVDVPHEEDLPRFRRDLRMAIERALEAPPADPELARPFRWKALFEKIEGVWLRLV